MKKVLSLIIAVIMMLIPLTAKCDDDITVTLDGTALVFDVPPQIIDGRTLVPVRAISETFDCRVEWDGGTRTVIIKSDVPENTAEPVKEPSAIPIAYDDTEERKAHYMRNFTITDAVQTDNGYDITYTLETFLEGRGTVGVTFNCYDKDGNVVDSFSDSFVGTDYTWSAHKAEASISDKTVKIELVLN